MMTTSTTAYLEHMAEALTLTEKSPVAGRNPRVACVLLDDSGSAVASGYHRGVGTPHAEVEALHDAASKGIDTAGLTAVVTLEPCNHHGSTGPCTEALISAELAGWCSEQRTQARSPVEVPRS
jgi:Pyrimidine deaminase